MTFEQLRDAAKRNGKAATWIRVPAAMRGGIATPSVLELSAEVKRTARVLYRLDNEAISALAAEMLLAYAA